MSVKQCTVQRYYPLSGKLTLIKIAEAVREDAIVKISDVQFVCDGCENLQKGKGVASGVVVSMISVCIALQVAIYLITNLRQLLISHLSLDLQYTICSY